MDQGVVELEAFFEKNAYAPSEIARVAVDIHNKDCKMAVQDVRFELIQTVTLRAEGLSSSFEFPVASKSLGMIPPGSNWEGKDRKYAELQLPAAQEGDVKKDKDLQNWQNDGKIVPSCDGKNIDSEFKLRVITDMEGCDCCNPDPMVSIPVQIYAAEFNQSIPPPQIPPNWQPQQMPQQNITIIVRPKPDGSQEIIINLGDLNNAPSIPSQLPMNSMQMNNSLPMNQSNMNIQSNYMNNNPMINNNMVPNQMYQPNQMNSINQMGGTPNNGMQSSQPIYNPHMNQSGGQPMQFTQPNPNPQVQNTQLVNNQTVSAEGQQNQMNQLPNNGVQNFQQQPMMTSTGGQMQMNPMYQPNQMNKMPMNNNMQYNNQMNMNPQPQYTNQNAFVQGNNGMVNQM